MGATRRPSIGEATVDVAFIGDHQPPDTTNLSTEFRLFLELAIPTCLLSFGFTLSPLLTASYVGLKFGPTYLSAFTLGNLTGNLSTFSLLAGIFSASDTLSPQAFGIGDYPEVGFIAMRGVVACLALVTPVNIFLVLYLEEILVAVGQDPVAAFHAAAWYRIFVWALPFVVIYDATWKFLSAQHVMKPLICVSIFSCVVILPLALEFFTERYGFLGSAMAYAMFQASQCILLLLYLALLKPHTEGTWPGLSQWRGALKLKPMMEYLSLGTGGILSQSEWVYWEALGLMVGNVGVIPLSAHTIPNQVIMIACQFPFSFGTALAIRMGHVLSKSAEHAQKLALGTSFFSIVFFAILSMAIYCNADRLIDVFTTDEEVSTLAESVWWKVAAFNVNVSVFALLCGTATGLGMQWTLGAINFFFLWIFGIPITYYFALVRGGGLASVWTWINVPYTCMNIALIIIFIMADWQEVHEKIIEREEACEALDVETQLEQEKQSDKMPLETQELLTPDFKVDSYGGLRP